MFPLDYLVAAALLAAPPSSEDPRGSSERYAGLIPTIKTIGVQWEILDSREAHYLLMRREDFRGDMNLLRERFHELLDAPPVSDCLRFPPRPYVTDLLAFNRSFRDHLEKCRVAGTTPDGHFEEMLNEVERLFQIWDAIRDSRCEYYYVTVRRQALKKARDLMGEDAFYSGRYPPHVPVWRFRRID
jgi:hypothetical protein